MVSEFHVALGQFLNYRLVLEETKPERELYLAVSEDIYETFFILLFTQKAIQKHQIKLLIYDSTKELIKEWKK